MSLTRFARTFTTSTRVMAANEKGMLEKAGDTIKQAAQAFKVSIAVSTVRNGCGYDCEAARDLPVRPKVIERCGLNGVMQEGTA
jgi:hypothetical protein